MIHYLRQKSEALAGEDWTFQARATNRSATGSDVPNEGKAITAADLTSPGTITCTVYDEDSATPGTPVATPSISSVALSALTVDSLWEGEDAIGRNFAHTIAGSVFSASDHTYLVLYVLTLTGGQIVELQFEHTALSKNPSGRSVGHP